MAKVSSLMVADIDRRITGKMAHPRKQLPNRVAASSKKAKVGASRGAGGASRDAASKKAAVGAPRGGTEQNVKKDGGTPALPNRQPRVWFMGCTIAMREGTQGAARDALTAAHQERPEWEQCEWKKRKELALKPFRQGILHGGWTRHIKKPRLTASPNTGEAVPSHVASNGQMPAIESAVGDTVPVTKKQSLLNKIELGVPVVFLGSGAFGQVYRCSAKPPSAVGEVAVKVLQKFRPLKGIEQGLDDLPIPEELINLMTLNGCSNIVQLLSWTETRFDLQLVFPCYDEDAFAAMERGLFEVDASGCDPLKTASKELLVGLRQMHGLQIIHRDLKPENLLMKAATGGRKLPSIVIADLGSSIRTAVDVKTAVGVPATNASEKNVGTYQFRAPELFLHDIHSYASDVWALGVCIANLDSGRVPFGVDRMQACQKHLVFFSALRALTTWVKKVDFNIKKLRVNAEQSSKFLKSIKSKAAGRFPWGVKRGIEFKKFTSHFFTIDAQSRASAIYIAQNAAYLQDAP